MAEKTPIKRERLVESSAYFPDTQFSLSFVPSGSTLLDCVLGGGYALGRVTNIVGDKSSGKTLLAMEASANFLLQYPKGEVVYMEAEAAFDEHYAMSLGIPIGKRMSVVKDISTVEEWFVHLENTIKHHKDKKIPGLYIVDSLDSLSDSAELERDLDQGSYGAEKAKKMGQIFRRVVRELENTEMGLIIISQVRDKIGVTFGEKHTRSGGRALDFYASQVVWLNHMKALPKVIKGIQRTIGIRVKAKCKKNKVALPLRECEFNILFNYGIDDQGSMTEWVRDIKKDANAAITRENVMRLWDEIEQSFLPTTRKY